MPTILIVEDEPVDRELACRCVSKIDSLEILEASDGQEALELCNHHRPDLVLTDMRMPRLDGLELVRELRHEMPAMPVILMTARGSERVAVEALEAGAVSYVPKAAMIELLVDTVEQALATARARRERQDVLRYFRSSESLFELTNDPTLISPLVAYFQDELERLGFGDDLARSQIGSALSEAISNSMIHGNLEIGSDLRSAGSEEYHRLITERRDAEPWSARMVRIWAEQRPDWVRYVIRDDGRGFDHRLLPDPTRPDTMLEARGRGLFLMSAFMDDVEYNESGNEVQLTKRA